MLLKDNVVAEDLVVPVRKVYNVLVKYKRLVAREHVARMVILNISVMFDQTYLNFQEFRII